MKRRNFETKTIAFIVSRLTQGGTERACLNAAIACVDAGMNVVIIVREADREITYAIPSSIRIVSLGMESGLGIIGKISRSKRLCDALSEIDPDWVVSFNHGYASLLLVGVFIRYKTLTSERFYPKKHYEGKRLRALVSWLTYSLSTRVVFQTPENRDCYGEHIRKKSIVIPNAIAPDLPEYEWRESNRVIVTACRLEPQKNLPLLIEAFSLFSDKNPGYELRIIGSGSQEVKLRKLADSLGVGESVTFLPFQAKVHERMLDAAMFVSSSDYEGIQNSLLEAIGMGIPSVATDCFGGGAKLLIGDNERGMLVNRGDAVALAAGMSRVVNDTVFAKSISVAGAELRSLYSTQSIADAWVRALS